MNIMNKRLYSELKTIYSDPTIENIQIIKMNQNRCKLILTSTIINASASTNANANATANASANTI